MTRRPNLAPYVDCTSIMETAIHAGGARIVFQTKGKAINFRQRCYRARKLLADSVAEIVPPGVMPTTQFDDLYIQLESDTAPEGSPMVLLFKLHSKRAKPALTDLDGNPIQEIEEPDFPDIKFGDL